MKPKVIYLIFCFLGVVLPYSQFVPWLMAHGPDGQLFVHQMFANPISGFFVMDVLVSAVALLSFVRREKLLGRAAQWLPFLAVLCVGVSLALPLYLYLREGKLDGPAPAED